MTSSTSFWRLYFLFEPISHSVQFPKVPVNDFKVDLLIKYLDETIRQVPQNNLFVLWMTDENSLANLFNRTHQRPPENKFLF